MSVVSLLGVKVLNNPANFGDAYEFEITFECLEQLQKGSFSKRNLPTSIYILILLLQISNGNLLTLGQQPRRLPSNSTRACERALTYFERSEHDQELDSLLVGPIPVGVNKFIFEADAPDLKRIPASEILGVTVILLTCSYDNREFVRVGYYVNNEYDTEELNKEPPAKPIMDRVRRNVLAEKPRVTRFAIKWYFMLPIGILLCLVLIEP